MRSQPALATFSTLALAGALVVVFAEGKPADALAAPETAPKAVAVESDDVAWIERANELKLARDKLAVEKARLSAKIESRKKALAETSPELADLQAVCKDLETKILQKSVALNSKCEKDGELSRLHSQGFANELIVARENALAEADPEFAALQGELGVLETDFSEKHAVLQEIYNGDGELKELFEKFNKASENHATESRKVLSEVGARLRARISAAGPITVPTVAPPPLPEMSDTDEKAEDGVRLRVRNAVPAGDSAPAKSAESADDDDLSELAE